MKMNKRLLFGIISIALAAVIALVGIPMILGSSNAKMNIVRVKAPITKGTVITAEHIELAEVVNYGFPADVAVDASQVVGKYALTDMVVGDYFLSAKVSATSPEKDLILSKLPDDKIAISMSVQSLAGILSNKLRTDDIVAVYRMTEEGAEKVEELQYVRIIAVSNANGTNIEDAVGDESRMASTLTFLADYTQASRMIELENDGPMHIVLVSRGDAKEAKKLLAEQDEILERIAIEKEMQEAENETEAFPLETEVP